MSTPAETTDVAHLCAVHHRPLHTHVLRKLSQRSDADDVVQETWLRVLKVAATGMLINGRAYVYRVAHNLIIDHYRLQRRRAETPLDEETAETLRDPSPAPEQRLLLDEQLRHLDAIVAALPPRSRQVFLLARVEQLSVAEIGRQLGISRQTAHGHLLRALVALQHVPAP